MGMKQEILLLCEAIKTYAALLRFYVKLFLL